MDVNSLISNKKGKKHHDGKGTDTSSTSICDLPDPILQIIISSLSTKDAVQTSVLSKRWVYLWRDISKIQLKEGAPEKRQQFIHFVRRLLQVCDCSNLKKFFLSCVVGKDAYQINEWLHGFINPKIEEINLDLKEIEEPLVFPDHLFTCATVTKFELRMNRIFNIPSAIYFESLRTLTLENIIFPDNSSTQQLFNSCPCLEELALCYCSWVNVKYVCISSPLLQNLIIWEQVGVDDAKSDEDYDIGGLNVSNCCNVVIIGTNLKSFSYDGDLNNDYSLYNSTSVIDAVVEVQAPDYWNEDWDRDAAYSAFRLLKALSNVEKLQISEIALSAISRTASLPGHLPLFCNLAELCVGNAVTPIELSCEALLTVLRNSPCLQVIEFLGGVFLSKDYAKNSYILDPLPKCFMEHLKTVKIYGFYGCDDEKDLHAINFLLQEASVMETLYIFSPSASFDSPARLNRMKQLYKQILRFPKGSVDCEIEFEYL